VTEITCYFPVAAGSPIARIIDKYIADFQRESSGIKVAPIYAGSYRETLTKTQSALKRETGPQMAVLLATDVFALIDEELILPFDSLTRNAEDKVWLSSFYPAFLKNGQIGGHLWSIPFQRSTIVLYWNKTAFGSVGLDPERPPQNWQEHAEFASQLTKAKAGKVERWGTQIPSSGFPYWSFQALATQAGGTLCNAAGVVTDFAGSPCVKALRYWILLNTEYHAHPPGIVEWGTTPRDFLEQKAAMVWTTTDHLTNIRNTAKFPFGVAMLPAGKQRGSPTGGGNFYLFKTATEPQRQACLRLLRWITSRERAARWGIDTGYIATRPDAWDTAAMRDHVSNFPPAAVARNQLRLAVPELSTHENHRVTKALDDALQAALVGLRDPEQALEQAQETAARLLRRFR
jgi:sn-glycerol 3-phosphate transport system substrate-binding protein